MRLELQIVIAVAVDLLVGDPRWLPHPVRAIGWLAVRLETIARRAIRTPRVAGAVTAVSVYAVAGLGAWGAVRMAALVDPLAADVVAIGIIYTTIAARDMTLHSMAVFRALVAADLPQARHRAAAIVGRDTDQLDEAGVLRATVESVAESTVDGVTAPLLFAVVAGPVGAMVYRAINTLDSMFGYRDERYGEFGWAAARIDDAANYLPARITAPLLCLAAMIVRRRPLAALRILVRDGRKHASPNAGLTEAAMAGALGVQLGGLDYYGRQPLEKPTLGDPLRPLERNHIRQANALMLLAAGLVLIVALAARAGAIQLWLTWRAAG
jgi:adenosylcobinamide-phosphate synthase